MTEKEMKVWVRVKDAFRKDGVRIVVRHDSELTSIYEVDVYDVTVWGATDFASRKGG